MLNTPFSAWPEYSEEDIEAIAQALRSGKVNYWTGSHCREFESEFAAWAGCEHAVSMANGTVALDAALRAVGIRRGDEVVVTPRTFLASASCIVNAGGAPVFADVDRDSQNITAASVEAVLTPRTRAVVAVHLAGWPCDMDPLMSLARERGLAVIEDCAQAHGARYKGRSVGTIGDIGAWSFCQDKILTTGGEGGMTTTRSEAYHRAMWSFKDHGKSWDAVYGRVHPAGFHWVHESFGTNARMLEVQAAIGRNQLRKLSAWHEARRSNAEAILRAARACPLFRAPAPPPPLEHAWYKLYLFVRPEVLKAGWTRDRMLEEISSRGVPCYPGSCSEVYLEKAFEATGFRPRRRLPVARELGETSLMLLVHPTLRPLEIAKTCAILTEVGRSACR